MFYVIAHIAQVIVINYEQVMFCLYVNKWVNNTLYIYACLLISHNFKFLSLANSTALFKIMTTDETTSFRD